MDFSETLRQFVSRYAFYLDDMPGLREEPLTATQLDAFETLHGFSFPESYRILLMTTGAGFLGFTEIFSPAPDSPVSFQAHRAFLQPYCPDVFPFAANGCGDYYAFPIVEGQCEDRILFIDHEIYYTACPTRYADFQGFCVSEYTRQYP